MRVVFDSNILISAFGFPGGRAEAALRIAQEGRVTLVISPPIYLELSEKLREKLEVDEPSIRKACLAVSAFSELVQPKIRLNVVPDDPDNRILECAAEGRAEMIVTGDKGLLALKTHQGVRIVTLAEFLKRHA